MFSHFMYGMHGGQVVLAMTPLMSLEGYTAALDRNSEYKLLVSQEQKARFSQGWRAAWYSKMVASKGVASQEGL